MTSHYAVYNLDLNEIFLKYTWQNMTSHYAVYNLDLNEIK